MDVFAAAREGDLDRVRAFVEQDAALVDATDYKGRTPLQFAAYYGHEEVARYLLDHGATIEHRGPHQRTAFHQACHKSHAGLVTLLLQREADVTAVDDWGKSPLMSAATDAIARMLLEHGGSDVDGVDHRGRTPCHWACSRGHSGVLRQLLEAGADPTVRDRDNRTSLDRATRKRYPQSMKALQEWHRAYTLHRARSVREASFVVANWSVPVDAASPFLVDRTTSGLPMPTVHVSIHQQHGQPSDIVGEQGRMEDPVAVGSVVTAYAIEELGGEVFVEAMELMGTTGCAAHEL